LCSSGWQELLSIMISVCDSFPYIEDFKFLSLRCIVRSKKLIDSCSSFSIVNFIDGCSLLNLLSVCSVCFGLVIYYIINLSKVCSYFLLGSGMFAYVPCAVYMFQSVLMMLGHPWQILGFLLVLVVKLKLVLFIIVCSMCNISFWMFMLISGLLSSILFKCLAR
jgi:hypothetical protein